MSRPLRVSIVAEGKTDFVILCAAIDSLLNGADYVPTLLQPEYPLGERPGPTGEGWGGVYRWCLQTRKQGQDRVGGAPILADVVIIHLDADVAAKTYAQAHITDSTGDLPCAKPCPPARATTDRLRKVMLRWCGESQLPEGFAFCTPSKSMETWVMAALFPNDKGMKAQGWECCDNPEGRLGAQPIARRLQKSEADYQTRSDEFRKNWPRLRNLLSEAERFSQEFAATPAVQRLLSQV